MFRGKSRGRGGRGRGGRQSTQPRGLFADGIWHCDCSPRLPAEHFKVKKEGQNQGRWFYTCQKADPDRCGFFLWNEDAQVREEGAVLGGRRSEPRAQAGWTAGREAEERSSALPPGRGLFQRMDGNSDDDDDNDSTASPSLSPSNRASTANKRSAHEAGMHEYGSADVDDEDQDHRRHSARPSDPMTPHKMQKTGVYATPATTARRALPWMEQSPSVEPQIKNEPGYFDTPSKQPVASSSTAHLRTVGPQTPAPLPTPDVAATPSLSTRHKDALVNPADDASSLTAEVLSALSATHVPSDTLSNLRSILTKHDLRNQGIKKGRDISRLALKAKDAKITELQARIASLEADRDVERWLGKTKKWDSARSGTYEE